MDDPLSLLVELTALERLPRSGWLRAGVPRPVESVAGHALGTALVALVLGPRVEPALDVGRAVQLAVLHDAPEALLGDLPRTAAELLPAGAKSAAEDAAARRLLAAAAPGALALWEEYRDGTSREARFVRVADKLQLGVQLLVYRRAGTRGLDEFLEGLTALDTGGFGPCEELRAALLAVLSDGGPVDSTA